MRTASWLMLSLLVVVFTPFGITAVAIDPINTVNPATGEMSFPLSLGSMPVGAGRTTTVDLYYKAGIRTDEEASPAGLGFSYGGGGITRKVVMVPDNNIGGQTSYHRDVYPGSTGQADCSYAVWYWAIALAAIVISIILTVLTWGASGSLVFSIFGALLTAAGSASSMYSMAKFQFTPQDYIAGGEHDPSYISTPGAMNEGRGYCNGATNDFPDIYYIATPYINGELIFCGPRFGDELPMGLRAGTGMLGSNVKIRYNVSTEQFTVTLSDGMRLIFGGTPATIARGNSRTNIYSGTYNGANNAQQCYVDNSTEQREAVAGGWLLGTIFYSDYATTDTDNDPLTNTNLNQGGWIAYCYNKITGLARRIPHSIDAGNKATAVFEPGVAGNYYFEDIYLDSIRTQIGKAQFNYATGRLDDVWFAENAMNWSYFSRFDASNDNTLAAIFGYIAGDPFAGTYNLIQSIINDNKINQTAMIPPEDQVTATSAGIVPIDRKILSAVVIKDIQGRTLQTSSLNTSYLLRPNSFYSMKKNTDGSWGYFTGNPQGACLTLTQIDVKDGVGLNSQSVQFSYANDAMGNPSGFNPARLSNIDGNTCPRPLQRHITFKDIWGYYKPNTGDRDDPNTEGAKEKAMNATDVPYSAAWSLREIGLPTGMAVQWKYEAGRYCRANNIQIKTDGSAKYGGSPRVKEIQIYDGVKSAPQRIAFFYTAMTTPGSFVENATSSNSSGHATVEPFPYLTVADGGTDSRPNAVRGGLYTPAKVAYEMTTVVQNYQPSGSATNTTAPSGYTTNEYITSKDFPNTGTYGETDNSCKRGMIHQITQYNSNSVIVSSKHYDYDYEAGEPVRLDQILSLGQYVDHRYVNIGVVRLLGVRDMVNNVTSIKSLKSSVDINGAPDRVGATRTVFQVSNRLAIKGYPNPGCGDEIVNYFRRDIALATMRPVGRLEPELNQLDIVSVIPYQVDPRYDFSCDIEPAPSKVYLDIRMVKGADMTNRNGLTINWSNVKKFELPPNIFLLEETPVCHFQGIGMFDVDNDGVSDDLVINYLRLVLGNNREKHIVFNDISINSSNDVTYSNSPLEVAGFYSIPAVSNPPFPVAETWESTCSYKDLVGGYSSCIGIYQDNLIVVNKFKDSYYADYDGQPNQIIETNSDRSMRVTVPKPAYWEDGTNGSSNTYLDMKNKNMLTQPCQNITYHIPSGTVLPIDPTLWKQNVVSASATKWAQFDGRWLPSASYVWKADKTSAVAGAEPTTSIDFADFNHTPNASNPNWQLTGTFDKYSAASDVLQTSNALGISSTTIYSNDNVLPIASVANAKYGECLFTNFTEIDIGVAVGATASMTSTTGEHLFSGRAAKITGSQGTTDQYARSQLTPVNTDIPALGSRTFVIDFWAKSSLPSTTSFIHLQSESDVWSTAPQFTVTNIWKKFSVVCTFPASVTDKKYRVVLRSPAIGPGNFTGGTIFYDDVRAYPKTALMTTTYYNPILRLPVVSIDANNNPGQLITYDGFGRPIEWRKIDKSNPAVTQLVSKKDYRLMGPGPYPLANTKFIMNYPSITFSWDGGYSIPSVNVKYTVKATRFAGGDGGFEGTITAPGSQKQVSLTIASPAYPGSGWYFWTVTAEAADGSAIVTARGEMGFAVSSAQYNN